MDNNLVIVEDDLEFDGDQSLYRGQPFCGIARQFYANGAIKREAHYQDGFEEGICRQWYPNGQLQLEWAAVHGQIHGKETQWYENGVVKSIGNYCKGVELSFNEWNYLGQLIIQRQIDMKSALYKYISGQIDQEN